MEITGYLVSNLFRVYLIYKFFRVFFSKCRIAKRWEIMAYGVFYVLNSVIYLVICIPIVTCITNIIGMLIISFFYEATLKQCVFCSFLQCAFMVCTEMITTYLIVDAVPKPIGKNEPDLTVVDYVITNLSAYPLILIMDRYKKVRNGETVPLLYWLLLLILPVSSIYVCVLLCMSQLQFKILIFLGAICLLGVNLIVFSLYDKILQSMQYKLEEAKILEQNRSYEKQLEIYRDFMEKTKDMRHDWKNHLAVISNMAADSENVKVVQYVNTLFQTVTSKKSYCNCGNTVIDAMVNYKCEEAERSGVSVEASIMISSEIEIEAMDISTIIGNLMDNAIRASKEFGDAAYINLFLKEKQGNIVIHIVNPYKNKLKVYNGIYQTTKQDKEEHGIGLMHIRKIVDKYNGELIIDTEENVFSVKAILFK